LTTTACLNKELATAFFHGFILLFFPDMYWLGSCCYPPKGESCPKMMGRLFFLLWPLEFSVRMLVGYWEFIDDLTMFDSVFLQRLVQSNWLRFLNTVPVTCRIHTKRLYRTFWNALLQHAGNGNIISIDRVKQKINNFQT
jgi:hypothetical protein